MKTHNGTMLLGTLLLAACGNLSPASDDAGEGVGVSEQGVTSSSSSLAPIGDVSASNAVGVPTVAAGALYTLVDETTSDEDTTYVRGGTASNVTTHVVKFRPSSSFDGHWVTAVTDGNVSAASVLTRARCSAACSITVQVTVLSAGVVIGTGAAHALTTAYTTFTDAMTFSTLPSSVSKLTVQVRFAAASGNTSAARYTMVRLKPTTACVASRVCSGSTMVYCDAAFGAFGDTGTPTNKIYRVDCVKEYGTGATCGNTDTFSGLQANCIQPGGSTGCTLPCLGTTNLVGCFETRNPPDLNTNCSKLGGTYHCGWRTGYGYDCVQ